mgnify:FL=1
MTFWNLLDTLFLKPLQLLFEVIYTLANRVITNPGAAIIVLSLLMNLLVLPLYKRADALQEEEKNTEQRLRRGVQHIKKVFKGDEKMMILQTYYRQNHYKPTYVLRGAISLLLEIPFFIAAYRFLSHLQLLQGASFGPIHDLGAPDGLLHIFGLTVNLLPIIMTCVNLVSCVIFTKGSPLKTKLQLYAMALFFLVFLYDSPSGLVFYWTLNNVFSLVKTIFYKLKHSKKILLAMASLAGLASLVYGLCFQSMPTLRRTAFFVLCGVVLQLPLVYSLVKTRLGLDKKLAAQTGNKKIFLTGALLLAVLIGLLIPSAVIRSSPQEFVDLTLYRNPVLYLVSSFCLAFGAFVVWLGVFYWLANPSARAIFDKAVWLLCGVCIVNYMFFGKNLGLLSSTLKFENGLSFSARQQLLNLAVLFAVAVALYLLFRLLKKHAAQVLAVFLVAVVGMSGFNLVKINASVSGLKDKAEDYSDAMPHFTLSKTGKNVVVFMLDRAMGSYIPYIFNEKPELKEQFSGFTYYDNCISFGGSTNLGSPALYGGYEYMPVEINKRDTESLASKQNEALKVLPVLFDENGYDVTVCDPVYANYEWIPDLSIYDAYPDIQTYITEGKFSDPTIKLQRITANNRNFFCYALMKASPLFLQKIVYDKGEYLQADTVAEIQLDTSSSQTADGLYRATGTNTAFMDAYNVLANLPQITHADAQAQGAFLIMANNTTHDPMMLQEPEYVPQASVDNTEYEALHSDRFTVNGVTLHMDDELDYTHYQSNVAAMQLLGQWFDYLRKNDLYDNTRIILVSDHGRELMQLNELVLADGTDLERFYPLLMVKDFNSDGFTVSEEFMTNADVPTLATSGLISDPINPFTGKLLDSSAKSGPLYVTDSTVWSTDENNGNTFLPANWYKVHDSIWNRENWELVAKDAVLKSED